MPSFKVCMVIDAYAGALWMSRLVHCVIKEIEDLLLSWPKTKMHDFLLALDQNRRYGEILTLMAN